MKLGFRIFVLLVGVLVATKVAHADVTYTISLTDLTNNLVTGTITTDGNTGYLTQSDILNWSITFGDGNTITSANSTETYDNEGLNQLIATATTLSWDFTGEPTLGFLRFSGNGTITDFVELDTGKIQLNGTFVDCCFAGPGPVAVVANVPEPASLSLLGLGIIGLGFVARRQLKLN